MAAAASVIKVVRRRRVKALVSVDVGIATERWRTSVVMKVFPGAETRSDRNLARGHLRR
jgi:hypothetical protein